MYEATPCHLLLSPKAYRLTIIKPAKLAVMGRKDIISKHVLKHLAADIANLLLSLNIEDDSVELLATEQHRIELRQADLVARVKQRDSDQSFILHV
ncbi:MAG TPA: hypothetical protein ENJ84_14875, partial [Gammaproteobacteria bacterium]|nr:hypothetical protein [Gammaproteobacteria bacterium]